MRERGFVHPAESEGIPALREAAASVVDLINRHRRHEITEQQLCAALADLPVARLVQTDEVIRQGAAGPLEVIQAAWLEGHVGTTARTVSMQIMRDAGWTQ